MTTPVDARRVPELPMEAREFEMLLAASVIAEQEGNYVELNPETVRRLVRAASPVPVDAAPPKDPDEIEALVDALASRIYEQAVATDCAYVRFAAERTALLSAVASLRARAEEAEDDRYHLQGRLKEACTRYERVASSLEKMRERVAGLAEKWERSIARDYRDPEYVDAKGRGALLGCCARVIENHADALRALDLSPSTPESADQPTDDDRARWDRETLP